MTFDSAIISALIVCLASIGLDFIIGVLLSIKKSEFSLSKLPQTIGKNIFPYIGGLIILALAGNYIPELTAVFYAGVGLVTVKFSKEALIDKVKELMI